MFYNSISRRNVTLVITAILVITLLAFALSPFKFPTTVNHQDKFLHVLGFAALVLPCAVLYPRLLVWIAPAAFALGGAIELIQPLFGREGWVDDFLAGLAGIVIGALLGLSIHMVSRLALRLFNRLNKA